MTPRVLVLVKRTSFRTFVLDAKDERTMRLLERNDPTVKRLESSHASHEATVEEVRVALTKLGAEITLREGNGAWFDDDRADDREGGHALVVTVGGDGTLLLASHHVGPDTPIVGINSAPETSVGFFCAGRRGSVFRTLKAALADKLTISRLSRMHVELNGEVVHRRVLNDALFCHASPAATSRYILAIKADAKSRPVVEEQRSSGLWVGPAAGSTAAQRSAGGRVLPLSSRSLQYVVREPYVRIGKPSRLLRGLVKDGGTLEIRSKMREGRLYLDGVHTKHTVGLGDVVAMRRSEDHLVVLGLRHR